MTLLTASFSLFLTGCASDPATNLNCKLFNGSEGRVVVTVNELVHGGSAIAVEARRLRTQLSQSPSMAGFIGSMSRRVAGTNTYGFAVRVNQLRGNVARQVALQQAYFNNGDTLVQTTKRWSCEVLADSVASLNLGQSSDQLLTNLQEVEQHFVETSKIFSSKKLVLER